MFSHQTGRLRSFLVAAVFCALSPATGCAFASAFEAHDYPRPNEKTISVASQGSVLVRDLPLENGGFQRVLYGAPATAPRGVIVMFPGGAGDIGIEK